MESLQGVMAKLFACDLEVNEFELWSFNCFRWDTFSLEKYKKPSFSLPMG